MKTVEPCEGTVDHTSIRMLVTKGEYNRRTLSTPIGFDGCHGGSVVVYAALGQHARVADGDRNAVDLRHDALACGRPAYCSSSC